MKILLLNPFIDAQHNLSVHLKGRGAALIFPTSVDEAWKMIQLHGSSLDLAIIHREPTTETTGQISGDGNFSLLAKIKGDPAYADLPVIGTSSQWTDAEFAQHQAGTSGANAYLRWPFLESDLVRTIETMFGTPMVASTTEGTGSIAMVEASSASLPGISLPELEVTSSGMERGPASPASSLSGTGTGSGISIQLEAPGGFEFQEATSEPPMTETGSLVLPVTADVSTPVVEELEPHERLMLANAAKANGQQDDKTMPTEMLSLDGEAHQQQPVELSMMSPGPVEPIQMREEEPVLDEELAVDLPYLFSPQKKQELRPRSNLIFTEPVGDAVVPGGAAQSPDIETLKKYLILREQDVAVLSNQLRTTREQLETVTKVLREEQSKNTELSHTVSASQHKIEEFGREKAVALESLEKENEELRFQTKTKTDKARVLEMQVHEATDEIEQLKERVRTDIRKIRVRERELENRLEIVKKDSEALIGARENKIMELKRKIDLLEFNMDLLQDQYAREKENSAQLRERLGKAAQVVRVAGGLLDNHPEKTDPKREAS